MVDKLTNKVSNFFSCLGECCIAKESLELKGLGLNFVVLFVVLFNYSWSLSIHLVCIIFDTIIRLCDDVKKLVTAF